MDALQRKQRLLEAIKGSDIAFLESWLKDGGNANSIFPNGNTLLITAIEAKNEKMVDLLIRAGADLDQRDFYDHTPLMYAAKNADPDSTQILIGAGAKVNTQNKDGKTALMYAAYNDSVEVVALLLNAGAGVDLRDQSDRSALNYGTYKKGRFCHDLLRKCGADGRLPSSKNWLTGFLKSWKASFSMDEFTELMRSPVWKLPHFGWALFVLPWLFVTNYYWPPFRWIFLLGIALPLTALFPSFFRIIPLGWEIMQIQVGKTRANKAQVLRLPRRVDTDNEVSFISRLIELGARELSSIHHTHFDEQSLPVKRSLWISRVGSILLAISMLGLVFVSLRFELPPQAGVEIMLLVCLLAWFLFHGWRRIVYQLERRLRTDRLRLVQIDRDRIAGELSNMLGADEFRDRELPSEFGLYLRAFMTTDKLHIHGFDFETMLAYLIAPTLPLIALGKPGEHLGAGRIRTSNQHWQEEILRLMEAARLIFIIPSHRPGTLWEISTLREGGFFAKTIFIMPPELQFHGDQFSNDWQKTVRAAREVGLEFPLHVPTGAFFRLSKEGEFEEYAPFLPEEFVKEFELEHPWEAEAGGSLEAAVEGSELMAAGAMGYHALASSSHHLANPFQYIDNHMGSESAESGGHYEDAGADDGSYDGYV